MGLMDKSKYIVRGSQGQLLAQEVVVEFLDEKPTIKVIPIAKGELDEIALKVKGGITLDEELIMSKCIDPQFTVEDLRGMSIKTNKALYIALMSVSVGKTQQELFDSLSASVKQPGSADFLSKSMQEKKDN